MKMIALAVSLALAAGVPVAAQAPGLAALRTLERGQWVLRGVGDGGPTRRLCLGDPSRLLRFSHATDRCRSFVVENTASSAVVNYSCGRAGNARTSLSVETPRLAQLRTQGTTPSGPFVYEWEARRVGACK